MKDIKNISIKNFLAEQGITPQTERQGYAMYQSPLRAESIPSFKVDFNKNLWYDFGLGEGGSIIDLVMILDNCSVGEAISKLESHTTISSHWQGSAQLAQTIQPLEPTQPAEPTIQITSVNPLQHRHLLQYIEFARSINLDAAREYCQEVHYTINNKPFYAVGFRSDGGGWELRNEYFKGGTSPKGVTTINRDSTICLLFEGFIDMLSFLTLKKATKSKLNIVVLNSVNNLNKVSQFLKTHQTIHCFLDNDEAGRKAVATVAKLGVKVIDQSSFYRNHKDLNDYLKNSKQVQIIKPAQPPIQPPAQQPSRRIKM